VRLTTPAAGLPAVWPWCSATRNACGRLPL